MSEASYHELSIIQGRDSGFAWTLVASMLLHAFLLAAGLVLYPAISSRVRHLPRIYTVSLVSLPGPSGAPAQTADNSALYALAPPEGADQPIPIHETLPNPVSLEKTEETPLPMPEDSLEANDQALARDEGKIEETPQLARRNETTMDRLAHRENVPGQAGPGINGRGGSPALNAVERNYLVVITNLINAHWVRLPAGLIRNQGPVRTVYIIQVDPSGRIQSAWFESRSGDGYLDQAVEKAVARSNPLPPLPKTLHQPYLEVGLVVTPTQKIKLPFVYKKAGMSRPWWWLAISA